MDQISFPESQIISHLVPPFLSAINNAKTFIVSCRMVPNDYDADILRLIGTALVPQGVPMLMT